MDSTREPLPAFVDPSLIEAPFEVAVLGSFRIRSTDVARDDDDADTMHGSLDSNVTHDVPAESSTVQTKRAARLAAKLEAKELAEAERLASAEAKSAAKQAKRDAKGARRGPADVVPAPQSVESDKADAPVAKKSGLSFDELIGGNSS